GLVEVGEPLVAEGVSAVIAPRLHRCGEVYDPRVLDQLGQLRLVKGQRRLVGRLEVLGLDVPARVDLANPAGQDGVDGLLVDQELVPPVGEVRHGRPGDVLVPPGGEVQQEYARVEVYLVGPAPVPGPVRHAVERGDEGRAGIGDAQGGEIAQRRVEQLADAPPDDEVGVEIQGPVQAGRQDEGDEQPGVCG